MANDEKVFKLIALFWGQFIKGAAPMDVAHDCIDEAIALGALQNIITRANDIEIPSGSLFVGGMRCCFRAGEGARKLAAELNANEITREIFREAFYAESEFIGRAIKLHSVGTGTGTVTILTTVCDPPG